MQITNRTCAAKPHPNAQNMIATENADSDTLNTCFGMIFDGETVHDACGIRKSTQNFNLRFSGNQHFSRFWSIHPTLMPENIFMQIYPGRMVETNGTAVFRNVV